jgi:hypothetical protein
MKRICITLLFCMISCLTFLEAQEVQKPGPSALVMHYALVGRSGGIEATIDLDKFVINWFEINMATFDQKSQSEKDEIARRLLIDESLDYVDVRLVNRGSRSISLNVLKDSLTVSFRKARARYVPDSDDADYPSELPGDSHAEVRISVATTTDAKMGIGRLAASLSKIDYLLRKELQRKSPSYPPLVSQDPTERPEVRMAPIAKSILEQDLFGQFAFGEEGLTVPLVLRISTTDE